MWNYILHVGYRSIRYILVYAEQFKMADIDYDYDTILSRYPTHGPDWMPNHVDLVESTMESIRERVYEWEDIWLEIGIPYLHREIEEEDSYRKIVWDRIYNNPVHVMKVTDTIGTEMFGNQMDANDSNIRYRHILYSVMNPRSNNDDILWVTVRDGSNGMRNVIVIRERSYFVFRAIATGLWRNIDGMHLFRHMFGMTFGNDLRNFEEHMYQNFSTIANMVDASLNHLVDYLEATKRNNPRSAGEKETTSNS